MAQEVNWSKTVFRLRELPNTVETTGDVASLVSQKLGDISHEHVLVCSLATSLKPYEDPPSRVATVMFTVPPSKITLHDQDKQEWHIPLEDNAYMCSYLIFDTHFLGMTPMNDAKPPHKYDCIAVSGLASHPLGSWQPKGNVKDFMWIRDQLPRAALNIRTVIYGYDSAMTESKSFQRIPDLARGLVTALATYGWDSPAAKPIAFLAHSLGGLLVKQALIQLATDSVDLYTRILGVVRGAIFFGVPNLGMNQSSFRVLVKNYANAALIDDIGEDSPYLDRLNCSFLENPLVTKLTCFWAYETLKSPTLVVNASGEVGRHGSEAILVSRESATCRLVHNNDSVTIPINATHSDMVKFERGSHYFDIVISKLSHILSSTRYVQQPISEAESPFGFNAGEHSVSGAQMETRNVRSLSTSGRQEPLRDKLKAVLRDFTRKSKLSDSEEADIRGTTYVDIQEAIGELQAFQEQKENQLYMGRTKPFLLSMQQLGDVAEHLGMVLGGSDLMNYVWGSMRYILRVLSELPDIFNKILTTYQEIGDAMPQLLEYETVFDSQSHLREVLVMIFQDILAFHADIIEQLNQRQWKRIFVFWWAGSARRINNTREKTARNKRLLENPVSIAKFESIHHDYMTSMHANDREMERHIKESKDAVLEWLSPYDCESEQGKLRKTRSVCKDPGRWFLESAKYKKWVGGGDHQSSLLWLSGIPGAGKTVLASVVVDHIRRVLKGSSDAVLGFFYCEHGDDTRNSFVTVARSILAQVLGRNTHLLPYFLGMTNGSASLTSESVAEEMLNTALRCFEKVYIVIDGLDECDRDSRKSITRWFRGLVDSADTEPGSIRCLFISQDDGALARDLCHVPTIEIKRQNVADIEEFINFRQKEIEDTFGAIKNAGVGKIVSARAGGMFIFAELFLNYLQDQPSVQALRDQLREENLPMELNQVYGRIYKRVLEARGNHMVSYIKRILGWIVYSQRPLRWREIQGAVCIDLENKSVDYDRRMVDGPKNLFASLVVMQDNGFVGLVHGTARQFLAKKDGLTGKPHLQPQDAHYSLAKLSLSYLSFPQFDLKRGLDDIKLDLLKGFYAFYDYVSVYWAIHLMLAVSDSNLGDEKLNDLRELLEKFIDMRWVRMPKPKPRDLKRISTALERIKPSSKDKDEKCTQAVGWAKKQTGPEGTVPNPDFEPLDLCQVTNKLRSACENLPREDSEGLQVFYGTKRFKCRRLNCYYYHEGFRTHRERKRHTNKHDRPFLCTVSGCPMELHGYPTDKELKTHLLVSHGRDEFHDTDTFDFPPQPREKRLKPTQRDRKYKCPRCDNSYTTNNNLKKHLQGHDGVTYKCDECNKEFTRKDALERHRGVHGESKFECSGSLENGEAWGCKASFNRRDRYLEHFQTIKGRNCVRPLLEEKSQASGDDRTTETNIFAGQIGENAAILFDIGKNLPSFSQFLKLCKLDESTIKTQSGATTPSQDQG
ncbi:hypothetical protein BJY04DRAFT_220054 [Aspergillus karnatakaensis]|uniref:uncharacterized protein n=1 Tax=Aspergillus karnatakaensis TaxID=1810916 RepID=UPI003CCDF5A2